MIWILCYLCTGAMYRAKLIEKYRGDVVKFNSFQNLTYSGTDFGSGLFDCLKGRHVIKRNIFACWCTPVRLAADASATGFMGYWLAIVLTGRFLPGIWRFGFIGRIHIRAEFGMEKQPVLDCCSWFWCYCCSLVQEAKFVDNGFRALRAGRTQILLESQELPIADAIPKARPETPVTEPPQTPAATGSGTPDIEQS